MAEADLLLGLEAFSVGSGGYRQASALCVASSAFPWRLCSFRLHPPQPHAQTAQACRRSPNKRWCLWRERYDRLVLANEGRAVMKNVMFIVLLFFTIFANFCYAGSNWIRYGENETYRLFYDPNTINKNESLVNFWVLFQVIKTGNNPVITVKSTMSLNSIDCSSRAAVILESIGFSGNMGTGVVISRDDTPEEVRILPGSSQDLLADRVCK
jgi:hypothetical protein